MPRRLRAEELPGELVARLGRRPAEGGPDGASWLRRLPSLTEQLLEEWDLDPEGHLWSGHTSLVLPVRRAGASLVLKVAWPHREAAGEHLGLRRWDGNGTVRLLAADPARGGLLLERLDHTRDLHGLWDEQACQVAGSLLARLHVPALPQVPRLLDLVTRTHARLLASPGALPPRLADRAVGLRRDLSADPDAGATLLHSDLHYANVLAAEREPWLAIDPKPMAGHPGCEILPLLRNRVDELGTGSSFRYLVRRRLEVVCEAAGIDERLARLWTIVMASVDAQWAHEDGDRAAVSLSIALMKAMEE